MNAPEDALAEILAEHVVRYGTDRGLCTCGWRGPLYDGRESTGHAHVVQVLAEWVAGEKARALEGAKDDIKARIQTFRDLGANDEYLNALNDAWGLVANRWRHAQKGQEADRG